MGAELFFTQISGQTTGTPSGKGVNLGTASPLDGLRFLDLLFTQLENDEKSETLDLTDNNIAAATNHLPELNPQDGGNFNFEINPAILNENLIQARQKYSDDINTEISEALALNQRIFETLSTTIEASPSLSIEASDIALPTAETNGLWPSAQQETLTETLREIIDPATLSAEDIVQIRTKLEALSDKIDAVQSSSNETNMLQNIKSQIQDLVVLYKEQEKQNTQDAKKVTHQTLPAQTANTILAPELVALIKNENSTLNNKNNLQDLAAGLNTLNIGEEDSSQTIQNPVMKSLLDVTTLFENILKPFSAAHDRPYTPTGTVKIPVEPENGPPQTETALQKTANAAQTIQMPSNEPILLSFDQTLLTYTLGTYTQGQALSVTGLENLTQQVTSHSHAAQANPASQTVAATIQKMAGYGTNRNITLHLDPPELGRVEVQMSFGKDKAVKTVLTIEKPETHLMLQRDAQTLERALQDAGLDTENGVSFELAPRWTRVHAG